MKNQSKLIALMLFLLFGLAIAGVIFHPTPVAAFEIKKGIVGNLSDKCQTTGDCSLCDFVDLFVVLQKVILSIFAGLALIMLIWGGQGMIMAAGNQEKFTGARKLIVSTLFGVLIILAAYFLISVLYIVLATPVGQAPKPILTQDWWKERFSCPAGPSDADYCKDKKDEDNVPCSSATNGVCKNKKCTAVDITDTCAKNNGVCISQSNCSSGGDLGKKDCSNGQTCCQPTNAGTCSAPAQCIPPQDCVAPYKESDWGIKDCSNGQTCCKFKSIYTPGACSSPAQCISRGGCSANDEDWGPKNCSSGQTCCVRLCPPQKSCRKETSCLELGANILPQYTCKTCNSDLGCAGPGPTVCCD